MDSMWKKEFQNSHWNEAIRRLPRFSSIVLPSPSRSENFFPHRIVSERGKLIQLFYFERTQKQISALNELPSPSPQYTECTNS